MKGPLRIRRRPLARHQVVGLVVVASAIALLIVPLFYVSSLLRYPQSTGSSFASLLFAAQDHVELTVSVDSYGDTLFVYLSVPEATVDVEAAVLVDGDSLSGVPGMNPDLHPVDIAGIRFRVYACTIQPGRRCMVTLRSADHLAQSFARSIYVPPEIGGSTRYYFRDESQRWHPETIVDRDIRWLAPDVVDLTLVCHLFGAGDILETPSDQFVGGSPAWKARIDRDSPPFALHILWTDNGREGWLQGILLTLGVTMSVAVSLLGWALKLFGLVPAILGRGLGNTGAQKPSSPPSAGD